MEHVVDAKTVHLDLSRKTINASLHVMQGMVHHSVQIKNIPMVKQIAPQTLKIKTMTSLFSKRATVLSYSIFLVAVLIVVQVSTFYGENRKLLSWLQKMVHERSKRANDIDNRHVHDANHIIPRNTRKVIGKKSNEITSKNEPSQPNHHAILMIHYHKTGFVLSRLLRKHAIEHFNHYIDKGGMSSGLNFTLPISKSWGSVLRPRRFEASSCPGDFGLQRGVINVQESPDFYCDLDEMARILLDEQSSYYGNSTNGRAGTKIIHFVRNPYSMALSNYYYHAQDPTPEPWVKHHNPCKAEYFNDTTTLKDLIFPTLSDKYILTKESFDEVVQLCNSLYQTKPNLEEEKFEGHLHKLDPIDGLKLSTAQMMIHGGGVRLMPGGDLLRMPNNIIRLKQLEDSLIDNENIYQPFSVVSLSMDKFITDPFQFTSTYLDVLIDDGQTLDETRRGKEQIPSIARKFAENYNELKSKSKDKHVTVGKHDNRHQLIEALKNDRVLGPILDAIESLVEDALQ